MENASKALIIAGAILISILLISVGIMVMNSASDVTGEAGEAMTSSAIQTFNAKFTNYAGKQKGSAIRELMNTIMANNATSEHKITVAWGSYTSASDISTNIKSTATYTVKIEDTSPEGAPDGYMDTITITP